MDYQKRCDRISFNPHYTFLTYPTAILRERKHVAFSFFFQEYESGNLGMASHTGDLELFNLSVKLLKREVPSLVGKKLVTASAIAT